MALGTKKARLASEYSVIFFCEKTQGGIAYPIFIKILRRHLALLGGVKKSEIVPSKVYKTAAGLEHRYTRDAKGTVWRVQTGIKNGIRYNNEAPVSPNTGGTPLILVLEKTIGSSGTQRSGTQAGKVRSFRRQTNVKTRIPVPPICSLSDVNDFIQKIKKVAKLEGWKYGDASENFVTGKSFSSGTSKKAGGTSKKANWYIPVGKIYDQKVNTDGSSNKSTGSRTDKGLVVATLSGKAALLLGLGKPREANAADIEKGTQYKTSKNNSIGSGRVDKEYTVFNKMIVYTQIWLDVKDSKTKTCLTTPGTGVHVKIRFTKNRVVGDVIKKVNTVKSNSSYAHILLPAGTPIGFVHNALMTMPKIGRSFQVSLDGKKYGLSYSLGGRNSNFGKDTNPVR
jgi:hypothetical protein